MQDVLTAAGVRHRLPVKRKACRVRANVPTGAGRVAMRSRDDPVDNEGDDFGGSLAADGAKVSDTGVLQHRVAASPERGALDGRADRPPGG